jgi:hypothetical protein
MSRGRVSVEVDGVCEKGRAPAELIDAQEGAGTETRPYKHAERE